MKGIPARYINDTTTSRAIYPSSKQTWYISLLICCKALLCVGIFVAYDLLNVANIVPLVCLLKFILATGHDCLVKHLHRIGIYQSPNCPLCNSNQEMDSEHLKICASVANHDNIFEKYWSARGRMSLLSNAWH